MISYKNSPFHEQLQNTKTQSYGNCQSGLDLFSMDATTSSHWLPRQEERKIPRSVTPISDEYPSLSHGYFLRYIVASF